MRDAFGGIVNISMIVIFLVAVSGYMAFNVTYTKAFRMKNKIITIYEQYEGCESNARTCEDKIQKYAGEIGYAYEDLNLTGQGCHREGYCVVKKENNVGETKKAYYNVTTYIVIEIPIINKIMEGMNIFHVTGSTRLINVT